MMGSAHTYCQGILTVGSFHKCDGRQALGLLARLPVLLNDMPRKNVRRGKPKEEYFHIAIRVDRHEIRLEASIHRDANHPEYAHNLDDRDPIYQFRANLTIVGTAFSPKERAGHSYEIEIYEEDSPSSGLDAQLKHLHSHDERGAFQYRSYRGKSVPVYAKPPGLALLNKERGKLQWTAWLRVLPRMASDMLAVLAGGRQVYLALTESTDERARWVRRLSLQTTDPTTEE